MALLSTCVGIAMEKELSVKERGFSVQKINRGLEVASIVRESPCRNVLKGSVIGSGFGNQELNREARPPLPGHKVGFM
jgi:hypothetical protein